MDDGRCCCGSGDAGCGVCALTEEPFKGRKYMTSKTYYGEYSLEHWIDMLLRQELLLPEYQRSFQWKPEDIKHFINSLKDHQFIPPVTIATYQRNGIVGNYIIDGQQRLTALVLAKLGYYPKPEDFRYVQDNVVDEEETEDERIEWTFERLISKKTTIEGIRPICEGGHYNVLECDIPADFFTNTYLGFAYIVPDEQDEAKQLPYFATVFRNINFQGIALSAKESRKALYYWNTELTNWFYPPFLNNCLHNSHNQIIKLDFVRYVSLLSQYCKVNGNMVDVFRGREYTAEKYYEKYIYSVAQNIDDPMFGQFSQLFANKEYQDDINHLETAIQLLGFSGLQFDNLVKLDFYLFGLIYFVVFKHCEANLNEEQKENLVTQLENKLRNYPRKYKDSSSIKEGLRLRMKDSIRVYSTYFPN